MMLGSDRGRTGDGTRGPCGWPLYCSTELRGAGLKGMLLMSDTLRQLSRTDRPMWRLQVWRLSASSMARTHCHSSAWHPVREPHCLRDRVGCVRNGVWGLGHLLAGRQAAYAPSMSPTSNTPARLQLLLLTHPGLPLLLLLLVAAECAALAVAALAAAACAAGVLGRGAAPGMSATLSVSRSSLSRTVALAENCIPLQHAGAGIRHMYSRAQCRVKFLPWGVLGCTHRHILHVLGCFVELVPGGLTCR